MEKEIEQFFKHCVSKTLHQTHIDILKMLSKKDMSITEVYNKLDFKDTKKKMPLLSYYLNGNSRTEGLIELKLISSKRQGIKKILTLTSLGLQILIFIGEK